MPDWFPARSREKTASAWASELGVSKYAIHYWCQKHGCTTGGAFALSKEQRVARARRGAQVIERRAREAFDRALRIAKHRHGEDYVLTTTELAELMGRSYRAAYNATRRYNYVPRDASSRKGTGRPKVAKGVSAKTAKRWASVAWV